VEYTVPETRGGRTLEAFCNQLVKGNKVIVRISAEERDMYSDMDYFVANIKEAPRKLVRGEIHGTNQFSAGWYVAKIRWYEKESINSAGDGIWNLLPVRRNTSYAMQCNAFT
jgi:hypothetical protein